MYFKYRIFIAPKAAILLIYETIQSKISFITEDDFSEKNESISLCSKVQSALD